MARRSRPPAADVPPPPFDGGPDGEPAPNDFFFFPDRPAVGKRPAKGSRARRAKRPR